MSVGRTLRKMVLNHSTLSASPLYFSTGAGPLLPAACPAAHDKATINE